MLYSGLKDQLFGVGGEWQFFVCKDCELVWLNPRPVNEDIEKLYNSYYTHFTNADLKNFALFRGIGRQSLHLRPGYSPGWRRQRDNCA